MVTWTGFYWFCLPVASSLCPHLCCLSWLGQAFPFLDKQSQSVPSMAAEEKSLVWVPVCPHGLFLCFMQIETLVCLELAI